MRRGDKVAATARQLASIAGLTAQYGANVLPLELDVTNPAQVKAAVAQAHAHFGRLDVVLNNAGYSLASTIEEASLDDIRALYETNILGAVSVIQAALPLLRAGQRPHPRHLQRAGPRHLAGYRLLRLLQVGVRGDL